MPAVILEVRLRPQNVGYLLLRAWRDGLVSLELGDGRLVRTRNVVVDGALVVVRHGEPFDRQHPQRMPPSPYPSENRLVESRPSGISARKFEPSRRSTGCP